MAYVAPIHHPSSVRHAIKLNFLDPDEECLAVAKSSRLELYAQTPDGLTLRHSKSVYGAITMLQRLRPSSSQTDHLFIGTDRYSYFTVSWNRDTNELQTENKFVDLADKSSRDSQTGDRCRVDPSRRFMTLELYEGIITIIPIAQKPGKNNVPDVGALTEPIPVRISEMFVRSSAFFETRLPASSKNKPNLALLHEDTMKKVRLKIRPLSYSPGLRDAGSVDLEEGAVTIPEELELGAAHLIPVPKPACGVLILGETSISYYEHSSGDFIRRPLKEATIFVAWEQVDGQRFVLADEYGKLYLFMLELDMDERVEGWRLDIIGETSRASVLVYLDAGNVFVGSHQGDSQVISIKPQGMDVIQTFPSIGPILDFTIMDMGSRNSEGQTNEYASGQARLVTGSGAFKDGSLRSVRSGVGLEDLGVLGAMDNITGMFSVHSACADAPADTLIVSFVDETRIFRFSPDGEVEELDSFASLVLDSGTLAAANVPGGRLLQVTDSSVRLTDPDGGMVTAEWKPPNGEVVTAVTFNNHNLAVASGGTRLIMLDLHHDLQQKAERLFGHENQIACINLTSFNPSICIIGFWSTSSLSILDVNSLDTLRTETTTAESSSMPRSLLVAKILEGQAPTLFVAMADGNVITFSMDPQSSALSARRSVVLGAQEASFKALPRGNGLHSVFAICEHPSLIYGSEGRLVYSAITAENASSVCPFDSQAYPGAIAIATPQELKLALIDEERSTHVQGLHVGETVRRIAYSSELKAFGLGTIKRTLEDGVEIVQSHFKLTDEVMFNVLATWSLNEDELVESVMRCQLDDGSNTGATAERFVIGTAYLDDARADSVRGRIIVLEVTEDRQLKEVVEHSVKGACRCLAIAGGKIVAALIKTVVVFDFNYSSPGTPHLTKAASYRTSTAPIDLSVTSTNIIVIADLMKSVSLVQYVPSDPISGAPDSLTEIARHFQTSWATAVAHIDDTTCIEADAEGNLLVLSRDTKSEFADDRRRLKVTAEMSLGEMVNRIRIINPASASASLEAADHPAAADMQTDAPQDLQLQQSQSQPQSQSVVSPKAFLATTTGSIYLFALIHPSKLDLLLRLQEQLSKLTRSPGHVPFAAYRAFRSQVRQADEPYRFVDGELLEVFLELSDAEQEEVVQKLGPVGWDVDGVRGLIEGLRRLR